MSTQLKIISIGAAVQDVFLQGAIFKPQKEHNSLVSEFTLGSKNEVDGIVHSTGGGATNASVTFSRFGAHSYFMGKIGRDVAGRIIMEELRKDDVDTSLVGYDEKLGTAYSTIMLAPDGERTVLTYRGASNNYKLSKDDFLNRTADWFYVSSLSGDLAALKVIASYARKHEIKIAVNPGKNEIEERIAFKELLSSFSILSLNKEEMQLLFGGETPHEILKAASRYVPIVLLTDGPKGSFATDGVKIYKAGMYKDVKVVDRIGAGDAFSSGFTAVIGSGGTIEEALTYASANSTSVVQQIGAKAGILRTADRAHLHEMKIHVSLL